MNWHGANGIVDDLKENHDQLIDIFTSAGQRELDTLIQGILREQQVERYPFRSLERVALREFSNRLYTDGDVERFIEAIRRDAQQSGRSLRPMAELKGIIFGWDNVPSCPSGEPCPSRAHFGGMCQAGPVPAQKNSVEIVVVSEPLLQHYLGRYADPSQGILREGVGHAPLPTGASTAQQAAAAC